MGHKPLATKYPDRLLGQKFGHLTVMSLDIARKDGCKLIYCACDLTGISDWVVYKSMLRGNTRSFRSKFWDPNCPITKTLRIRYHNMVARCTRPSDADYKNYGARGIQCKFTSAQEYVLHIRTTLPHADYIGVQIDRINNDGHYEPGNLKLSTIRENNLNKQNNLKVTIAGKSVLLCETCLPYSFSTTRSYLSKGMTFEEIIAQARATVAERRNNHWQSIAKRLKAYDAAYNP